MKRPVRRLHNRLMFAFAGFAVVVVGIFGLYVAAFSYAVEDQFFDSMLGREAAAQLRHRDSSGEWAEPREPFMVVIEEPAALPADMAATLRAQPSRREFPGSQGRHYHVRALIPADASARAWLVAEVSQQLVVRPMRGTLLQVLAWSGVLMLALALLLGYWMARRTSAPLSRLADVVDGTSPARFPGAFSQSFPDDETGLLARALEQLINRIHTFTDREREFTRDASHELRTPLAVIRGGCEQLATEPGLSDSGKQQLTHVRQSAEQLEQTVNTLLSLAREMQPQDASQEAALLATLERVIVEQAQHLDGKPVDVALFVPSGAKVAIPAPILHILLSNLVGNAFAHTDAGEVRIDLHAGRLRIANPGSAVSDDAFEPHVKGPASAGFGLGLSIVRRLCERHDIDLRIEASGKRIVASLPIKP